MTLSPKRLTEMWHWLEESEARIAMAEKVTMSRAEMENINAIIRDLLMRNQYMQRRRNMRVV